ncbi:MAG: SHOCT domain-containing protein [Clostridia bacterium]|nr:SHOCT domain-containing protein [Clostridia bacterium]
MLTMIGLAIAYIAIALSVIRNLEMKRLGYVRRRGRFGRHYWEPAIPLQAEVEEEKPEPKKENAGAEEKLEKIKKLLDSGMITQEEYEEKRKKIIEEI